MEQWLTFLAIVRADSMAYSQEKASIKKKLKAKILEDLSELEGNSEQDGGAQYDYF